MRAYLAFIFYCNNLARIQLKQPKDNISLPSLVFARASKAKMSRSSPIRRSHIHNNNSSPVPVPPSPESTKSTGRRRHRPTITPRTFTRFFTPRSIRDAHPSNKVGSSRRILRDITAAATNRQDRGNPDSVIISMTSVDIENNQPQAKRRRLADLDGSSAVDLSRESPRRICSPATGNIDRNPNAVLDIDNGFDNFEHDDARPISIDYYASRNHPSTGLLRQELGLAQSSAISAGVDWQNETTDFSTAPGDTHICRNVMPSGPPMALPFCTASCNRTSRPYVRKSVVIDL